MNIKEFAAKQKEILEAKLAELREELDECEDKNQHLKQIPIKTMISKIVRELEMLEKLGL